MGVRSRVSHTRGEQRRFGKQNCRLSRFCPSYDISGTVWRAERPKFLPLVQPQDTTTVPTIISTMKGGRSKTFDSIPKKYPQLGHALSWDRERRPVSLRFGIELNQSQSGTDKSTPEQDCRKIGFLLPAKSKSSLRPRLPNKKNSENVIAISDRE